MYFLGLGTSSLFAAGLAFLVILTFFAGLVKVALNKRDLKKKIKLAKLEAANKETDLEKLVGQRPLDEGDLFGVRAIQAGFFGGVTQSCPNSPVPSRSSSLNSLEIKYCESHSPKPSPCRLEPPRPTCNISLSSRKTSASSQRSSSGSDSNISSHPENSNSYDELGIVARPRALLI
ncbi:hypothetical protein HI914_00744 [Erysiphe necator]|uniref:Uncharacterized protein n=1 Tax=Uncinula necator TaxID=52586 RepID=A0A0B1NXS8_UNCNE|nr:hypothetical protein HI914_00744 [Erysiphe necator]KHJ31192.1 hypothetical protein EV44_g0051 [Erysiphe necator]